MRARDLTEEINRATDMATAENLPMVAGAEDLSVVQEKPVVGRERVQRMGWQVIESGRHDVADPENKTEILSAARKVERDEQELTRAQEFVGDESKLQVKEREKDDLEDAQNEAGMGLAFENRIVAKNQEAVAWMVTPEVDKMVNQKSFRISELERLYRHGVNTTLGIFNRRIGDRN